MGFIEYGILLSCSYIGEMNWFDDDRFILTPNRRKHIYLKQKINDWRWGQIKYVVARNSIGCEPKHSKSELVDDGMEWNEPAVI